MTCDVCGLDQRQPRLIHHSITIDDQLIVIDHVPAEVCPRCGEVSIAPEVVERLQNTIWQHQTPSRTIETPIYEYA